MAAVDAHPQLVRRAGAASVVGGHERVNQERAQAEAASQFPAGHRQQRRVAAVCVQEDEPLGPRRRHRPAHVGGHRQQRLGGQPQRARRPSVLVRLGDRQRRQQPGVGLLAAAGHRGAPRLLGYHMVDRQRQVRPVLLDGADGPHQHRAGADALGDLGCGEVLQPTRRAGVRAGAHRRHATGAAAGLPSVGPRASSARYRRNSRARHPSCADDAAVKPPRLDVGGTPAPVTATERRPRRRCAPRRPRRPHRGRWPRRCRTGRRPAWRNG